MFILTFLKSTLGKIIGGTLIVVMLLGMLYYKGRADGRNRIIAQYNKEIIKREKEKNKAAEKGKKVRRLIDEKRKDPGSLDDLDKFYSCLLQGDPIKDKCP